MERLTIRQKEVFDAILDSNGEISMGKIAKLSRPRISRQAVSERISQIVQKGYLHKVDGKYMVTTEGLDKILKDGGKTKHSYYDKREVWEKTLRPNGFSKEIEEGIQP